MRITSYKHWLLFFDEIDVIADEVVFLTENFGLSLKFELLEMLFHEKLGQILLFLLAHHQLASYKFSS